jgi:hypothetical protein
MTRGIAARETLFYLERHGIYAEPLLSKAQLSRSQLVEDAAAVSAASQHSLLELAASEAKDPLLGLHVAAEVDLRDIGLLFYLAASSAAVRKPSNTWRDTPVRQAKKFALRFRMATTGQP